MACNYTSTSSKSDTSSRSSSFNDKSEFWKNSLLEVEFPSAPMSEYPMYTLDELCDIDPSVGSRSEICLSDWLTEEIKEFKGTQKNFLVCADKEIQGFKQLVAFGPGPKMRPDVSIFHKKDDTKMNLPVLLFEVVSGNNEYSTTLSHSIISLIYQLRYLSHFCDKRSLCGFVFPKRRSKSPVTKITLEWRDLGFYSSYEFLKKDEIINSIQSVVTSQCEADYYNPISVSLFEFMRLNDADLGYLGEFTKSKLEQVNKSAYSILTKDENYYYKIVPFTNFRETLANILKKTEKLGESSVRVNRLVLPKDYIPVKNLQLFQFEALPHQPLKLEEVKLCLTDFVNQAIEAILQLHEFGYAHTDIRLPNFCFSNGDELRLIDFDRAEIATRTTNSKDYSFENVASLDPSSKSTPFKCIDFTQLGLLILSVTRPDLKKDNWSALRTKTANPVTLPEFIQNLIEGNYYQDHHDKWHESKSSNYKKSIRDVLCERSIE